MKKQTLVMFLLAVFVISCFAGCNFSRVEQISNVGIVYRENEGRYMFYFSLLDANKNYVIWDTTIEMFIVNSGEIVYKDTIYTTTTDFYDFSTSFNEKWTGVGVYIYDNWISGGLSSSGTLNYKITVGEKVYQSTIGISGLPRRLSLGQKWVVDDLWEFSIDSVETHYACAEPNAYRDNNLAQYVKITYSYKNLGYQPLATVALNFSYSEFTVFDAEGTAGKYYLCSEHCTKGEKLTVGAKCSGAQEVFGLVNQSDEIRIRVQKDGKRIEYRIKLENVQ